MAAAVVGLPTQENLNGEVRIFFWRNFFGAISRILFMHLCGVLFSFPQNVHSDNFETILKHRVHACLHCE